MLNRPSFTDLIQRDKLPGDLRRFDDTLNLLRPGKTLHAQDIDNTPNLLIDQLDQLDENAKDRVKNILDSIHGPGKQVNLAFLIGPSGCGGLMFRNNFYTFLIAFFCAGKTRTTFECLSQTFGLFFTATAESNGGSRDLEKIIKKSEKSGPEYSVQLFLEFLNIVILRIEFLDTLKQVLEERGLYLKPWHWLMMQEMPHRIFGYDVFHNLNQHHKCSQVLEIVKESGQLSTSEKFLPIFVDESQVLLSTSDENNFYSATSLDNTLNKLEANEKIIDYPDSSKPMLNTFLYVAHLLCPRDSTCDTTKLLFIFSGTGLQVKDVEVSAESPLLKSFKSRAYITLGSFLEYEPFREYVQRYTSSLDDKLVELHSVLRGRYRFTAAFLALYLKWGQIETALEQVRLNFMTNIAKSISKLEPSLDRLPENETIANYINKEHFLQSLMFQFFLFDSSTKPIAKPAVEDVKHIQYGLTLVSPFTDDKPFVYYKLDHILTVVKIAEPLIFEILHQVSTSNPTNSKAMK